MFVECLNCKEFIIFLFPTLIPLRDESHITKTVMSINVDGHPRRGRPTKRWMDCVKDDMRIKGVSMEMTSDRREWKKKTCCADPT
jgi:hypothetical protein